MGITKNQYFTAEQNELAYLIKALANPARIAIVQHLLKVNSCICSDIVNELPLAQSTISQHLKELKTSGIIKGSIEHNNYCYCINNDAIQKLLEFVNSLSNHIKTKTNCC